MQKDALNIVVTGVGGQGQITLARVIAEAALIRGINAIVAETHGLSQRGGTVIVHVRLGNADAPLIPPGAAHVLLSMELIEAARYSHYLARDSIAVVNDYLVPPPLPGIKVPSTDELVSTIKERAGSLVIIPATQKALETGDVRVANMMLLGAAIEAGAFRDYIDMGSAEKAIQSVLGKAARQNIAALHNGAELARKAIKQ